ncbi:MAG: hypothetical protein AAGI50_06405 [Pseudomonadota bacterium]
MDDVSLTPAIATALFVIAVVAGYRYRRTWKMEGPAWQLWLYGSVAAVCLLTVGFVPLRWD